MANISKVDRHVAVLPFPFSSHPSRLLRLVRRLATAAPTVAFSFYTTPQSIASLFSPSKKVPENIKPYAVWDGVPEGYVFSGKPQEHINLYLAAVEEGEISLKEVLKAAEAEVGRKIGCVISDSFLWFAGDLAEEMGVPWVLSCAGARALSAHFYTDLIRETVGIHDIAGRENDIVKFVPGFSELRLGDLPIGVLFGNLESPFAVMLHKMGRALPKATAIAVNSFEELDPEINQDLKSKLKMFLNVGPFNSISSSSSPPPPSSFSDEYGCIAWLDNHKAVSVAYIGFGTVATLPPAEIAALAEALEANGTPFLWLEDGVFTKSGAMSALEMVLSSEKGKELREQAGKFRELALKAVGPKGSSTRNLNTLLEVVTRYNL
ncbi:hypothetical protein RHSIM_Rhsim08G0083700 [Rhododendron simsii]|uniref:Uncharacterized protein n=1 Tax=Rhododendron simsii TaxID=118357 RepID=A0A834LG21_RHOSS|nr:hypothetical protein RHSIM_Rhsim08G0083700 [Rhododendron simsii]